MQNMHIKFSIFQLVIVWFGFLARSSINSNSVQNTICNRYDFRALLIAGCVHDGILLWTRALRIIPVGSKGRK